MIVFRLCRSAWKEDLSGQGAKITGGRWNSKGIAVVYTSSSRALCVAEIAVHTPLGCLPQDYYLIEILIPENSSVREIQVSDLPRNWQSFEKRQITQQIGNSFIQQSQDLILKVPSAVVQGDFNYLINPMHIDIKNISVKSIEEFRFDGRLFDDKLRDF